VAKAVLIGAVSPLILKTEKNPGGLPMKAFDEIRAGVQADRSEFWKDLSLPFYGYNRPGAKISEGVRESFWLQGMMADLIAPDLPGISSILCSLRTHLNPAFHCLFPVYFRVDEQSVNALFAFKLSLRFDLLGAGLGAYSKIGEEPEMERRAWRCSDYPLGI